MRYRFQSGAEIYEVALERAGEVFHATIAGQTYIVEVLDQQPGQIRLRMDGKPVTLHWAASNSQKWVAVDGCTYLLERPTAARAARPGGESGGETVRAPMPAQVRAVQVTEGDAVAKGQTLLLLEAMKMEIRIKAPADGKVAKLLVQPGQAVEKDQTLVLIGD